MTLFKTLERQPGEDATVCNGKNRPRKPSPMWREIYHEFCRWAKVSNHAIATYKRTEIAVETDRVWIIRKSHSKRAWCEHCGREVDMVGLKEAAALAGVEQPLFLGIDGRGWHRAQAADGSPLICLESLRLQ